MCAGGWGMHVDMEVSIHISACVCLTVCMSMGPGIDINNCLTFQANKFSVDLVKFIK